MSTQAGRVEFILRYVTGAFLIILSLPVLWSDAAPALALRVVYGSVLLSGLALVRRTISSSRHGAAIRLYPDRLVIRDLGNDQDIPLREIARIEKVFSSTGGGTVWLRDGKRVTLPNLAGTWTVMVEANRRIPPPLE